jgi:hypothetical protein
VLDLLPHASPRLGIEAGRRLVEEEDLRPMDDPEADVEPAAHAARVRAGRSVRGRLEVEGREDLGRAGFGVGRVHAVEPALDDELATAGLGRVGRAALRDVADALPDEARLAPQVGAGDGCLARGRLDERREHPERGGLARPVWPQEAENLPGADMQIDARDGLDGPGPGLERALEIRRVDHRAADRGGVRHVDAPWSPGRCSPPAVLARFSIMGQYLSSADSYPVRSRCQP